MDKLREHFPILDIEVNQSPLIYFDNAATSQKPTRVIDAISRYYRESNSNVHRSVHTLAGESTRLYEEAHQVVAKYIGAKESEVFFTRNCTEGINFVANVLADSHFEEGDVIVLTEMEHHSNIVPWQILARKKNLKLEWIPVVGDNCSLDLEYLHFLTRKYREKIKLITFVHTSNVLGVTNDVDQIVRLAKSVGALTLLDGAQSVAHQKVDVKKLDVDFFVFSGHKMYGPTGIGVVYGRQEILESVEPWHGGGEMISKVWKTGAEWADPPQKFEAGTPNIGGGVGLMSAVKWINKHIDFERSCDHEALLVKMAVAGMGVNPRITLLGPKSPESRGSVVSFGVKDLHPHDLATLLDERGIAIRAGYHCAQPLHDKFQFGPSARISFMPYNTVEEVRTFLRSLNEILRKF